MSKPWQSFVRVEINLWAGQWIVKEAIFADNKSSFVILLWLIRHISIKQEGLIAIACGFYISILFPQILKHNREKRLNMQYLYQDLQLFQNSLNQIAFLVFGLEARLKFLRKTWKTYLLKLSKLISCHSMLRSWKIFGIDWWRFLE